MYTDVYFTNVTPVSDKNTRIAFFQKNEMAMHSCSPIFKDIMECQYGWSHRIRIPWDLSFRLAKAPGNTSSLYPLISCCIPESRKNLLSRDGTVTVRQHYGNGKEILDFELTKGDPYDSVQIYRGKFLVAKQSFREKHACFHMDNTIHVIESYSKNEIREVTEKKCGTLEFDLTGIRKIHLVLTGSQQTGNKLTIHSFEKW